MKCWGKEKLSLTILQCCIQVQFVDALLRHRQISTITCVCLIKDDKVGNLSDLTAHKISHINVSKW